MKRYKAVVGDCSLTHASCPRGVTHRIDYEEYVGRPKEPLPVYLVSEVDAEIKLLRKRIDDLYPVAAYRCEAHEDEEAAGICPCCERVEVARLRAVLDLSVRGELEETARRMDLEKQVEALRAVAGAAVGHPWHELKAALQRARDCGALP